MTLRIPFMRVSLLVPSSLVWLTLQEVHTGWCEELPVMLHCMLALSLASILYLTAVGTTRKVCWIDKAVFLWFAYITFNYWFISPYPAGERYFMFLSSFLLYILLRYILPDNGKCNIVPVIAAGGVYEAIIGLMQLSGMEHSRHSLFAVTGTFFNPGPYSAYLVVVLSTVTTYIYKRRKLYNFSYRPKRIPYRNVLPAGQYIICGIAFYTSAVMLPATWSRAAFVGYFVVLLILLYSKHRKWIGSLVCISVIAGISLYFIKQGSANGRILMNTVSMRSIVENPAFGCGLGGFANTFAESQAEYFRENLDSPFVNVAGSPEYAFNELLSIGMEQGGIGMLFFALITVGSCIRLFSKKEDLAYGWLALLIFSLFSYPFSLQPFRIMAVMFVAYAANSIGCNKDNYPRSKVPHILLTTCVLVITYCMIPRIKQKVHTTKEWDKISNYPSVVFADEYNEWYTTLSDNPKFLFTYGKMLNGMKRYNDSNAALHDGIKVSSDPMFHIVIGNNYKELEAYKEAEEHYAIAYYMTPNRMYPLYLLLKLYIDTDNNYAAQQKAKQIVRFNPKIRSSATDDMRHFAKEYIMQNEKKDK